MALHQQVQGTLQGIAPQRSLQTQRHRDVVGRAVRIQAPDEPLAFLGERQLRR